MANPAPQIDQRTAEAIAKQVRDLLAVYVPDWRETYRDPVTGETRTDRFGTALIGIFARFAETIVQRLNDVLDKSLLAFLNLLGASRLPPQPARVPLVFTLVEGSAADAVVPAGTQVAASPAEGEEAPVVFETERELAVTAAQLASVFVRDPEQDACADHSEIATSAALSGVPVFRGNRRSEHIFYLGHNALFSYPALRELRLTVDLEQDVEKPRDARALRWEMWDGTRWIQVTPVADGDGTENLTQGGDIVFADLARVPPRTVHRLESRWLRCRLLTRITPARDEREGMVRASQLPSIQNIGMRGEVGGLGLAAEQAFSNALAVDLSKDFFPFGEKPRFGDTLYLANNEAFSHAEGNITFHIVLTNPASGGAGSPIPPTQASPDIGLAWESWDGTAWASLTPSEDTTAHLTKSGRVVLQLPGQPMATVVNGVEGFWVRARIVSGNYGTEAHYELAQALHPLFSISPNPFQDELNAGQVSETLRNEFQEKGEIMLGQDVLVATRQQGSGWLLIDQETTVYTIEKESDMLKVYTRGEEGYRLVPADFAPPSIHSVAIDYDSAEDTSPETILTYNNGEYALETANGRTGSFVPFQYTKDECPALYMGFELPPSRSSFPNRTLSLYARTADTKYGERVAPLWPNRSRETGDPGSVVVHRLLLINASPQPVRCELATLGMRWAAAVIPQKVNLAAGKSVEVNVRVTVPANAPLDSSDSGFVRLTMTSDPASEHYATFVTFAGPELPPGERLELSWQYWNGTAWTKLTVHDGSENLTRSGVIQFLAPSDFDRCSEFGLDLYWLRVCWESGEYPFEPRLRRLLINATMAAQMVTIRNEILGSSDGSEHQTFRTARTPVLAGPQLQVRESEMPSSEERAVLEREEGPDALPSAVEDAAGRARDIWVRWHQAPDFYGSGPRDRHYVFDHLTGEVRFGDGVNGLVPPAGSGNIRIARYQTGGGIAGNKPAGAIVQLKTTVPYVDKVTNAEAATGGAGAEVLDLLLARAPRGIRHRDRAVTREDYEDLAILASPKVARARCVPLYDLDADPDAEHLQAGAVSLIVVPRSTDAKPMPDRELIERVRGYVDEHRLPNVGLVVVGPEYVRVDVEAEIALVALEGASQVEAEVGRALSRYLHPLTGGLDGAGWGFGRKPHRSDLYALLEGIAGVDHVRLLNVEEVEDREGVSKADRFLVYSGTHTTRLTFQER